MVIAMCIENHGCAMGAAGGVDPANVAISTEDWMKTNKQKIKAPQLRMTSRLLGRGSMGGGYNRPIWGG